MKIALVSDAAYPFTRGGRETRYYEIARRLVQRGHDVDLFTFKWWPNEGPFVQDGIVYHGSTPPRFRRFVRGRRSITEAVHFASTVPRLLRGHRFDVIECDEFPYVHFPLVYLTARLTGTPIVGGWWECWDRYWYRYLGLLGGAGRFVERVAARLADRIVVETECNKRTLCTWGIPASRIAVIPSGVDFARAQAAAPSQERYDVVYVGRLLRTKGIYTLIEALRYLHARRRTVTAAIVGDGPERGALECCVKQEGLAEHVRLLGYVDKTEDVYAVMKAAKVYVYPVAMEGGWSVGAVEAQACGLPVITFSGGALGTCELVQDGHNGVLLPGIRMAQELAEGVWSLLGDEPMRAQMRERALEFARARDWQVISESVERTYEAAIAAG